MLTIEVLWKPETRRGIRAATVRERCRSTLADGRGSAQSFSLRLVFAYFFLYQMLIAVGAYAVAELHGGVGGDIGIDLLPIVLIVANLFAIRADGQKALKLVHIGNGRL